MEHQYYLGIDIDDENAIVSFFRPDMREPETVSAVAGSEIYQIPVVMARNRGSGQWHIGEEARKLALKQGERETGSLLSRALGQEMLYEGQEEIPAEELLEIYFKKLLYLAGSLGNPMLPDKLVISLERLSREVTALLFRIAGRLGLSGEQMTLIDRRESFYYFIYSQEKSLWLHDVCLFDYRRDLLWCCRAERNLHTRPQVVTISEEVKYMDASKKDEGFLQAARGQMEGHIVSAAYLVGDGFSGGWMKASLSFLCRGRRAFMGKNLYSKGACYAAAVKAGGTDWDFVYMGDNEMKVNVSLKVRDLGKTELLTLISAGDNWYEAVGECEVLLDDTREIDFWLQAPNSREAKVEKIALADLPQRPPKTTRIRITVKPLSDTRVQIRMKDMGFGEIFKSSDKSWEYIMAL